MRFYSNENFPLPAVEALRKAGHDVLTSYEAGNANQRIPDDEVLEFARQEGRVLLTFNRKDFIALHNQWADTKTPHAGILVCKQHGNFELLTQCILELIDEDSSLAGQLVRVNRSAT